MCVVLAVFSYTPLHDVVEVNQQGYDTCTVANAIATYNTGETVIHLTSEGTRYFVCGRLGHCQQGLKLEVRIPIQSSNNGTDDNQNQPGGGRRSPSPPRSPPLNPPPPHRFSLSPSDAPPDAPAEEPCDCSSAGEGRLGCAIDHLRFLLVFFVLCPFASIGFC